MRQTFGVPVGTLVPLEVLETTLEVDTELVNVDEVVTGVEIDVDVEVAVGKVDVVDEAMHEQALLTLALTSPVQAAAAKLGIDTDAEAVVKVPQKDWASEIFAGARRARRLWGS